MDLPQHFSKLDRHDQTENVLIEMTDHNHFNGPGPNLSQAEYVKKWETAQKSNNWAKNKVHVRYNNPNASYVMVSH